MIYWTLILAALFTALQGAFTLGNFVLGVVVSAGVMLVMRPYFEKRPSARWAPLPTVKLAAVFAGDLLASCARVLLACLSVRPNLQPAVIAVPLEGVTDVEITALANLVTLTPGTLSVHVAEDHKFLYVHMLFAPPDQVDAIIRCIKRTEKLVMEAAI